MEKIRVLHVLHSMNCGGAETLIMNIYRNIDKEKVQFDFLVNVDTQMFYESEINSLGGRIFRMPFLTKISPPVYERNLYKFFKEHGYRIVHSHLETTTGIILKQAKKAGVPVRIAHSHNSRFTRKGLTALPENMYKAYCRTKVVPNATKLFGCSELANVWLYGKNADKSEIINNGIDTNACRFSENVRNEVRDELSVPENVRVFGHVGRFNDQKNHLFLVDIFNDYLKVNKDSLLLLAGEGDLMDTVRAKVKALSIEDKVVFLGLRKDVGRILQAFDFFLLPSKFEGLPLVIVEAQAAGLKCLAADTISPMSDLSLSLVSFLPIDSTKHWVEKMNSPAYKRSTEAADGVAEAGFDSLTQAKKLQSFYIESVEALM
ncbi:MAG: glycosyltransferase family 1 protein [Clostridia bacterium]|nr:glycosyltransferase family 1 protein [Clostridia bacterium]